MATSQWAADIRIVDHVCHRQWRKLVKPRPCEEGHQRQPERRFSLSGHGPITSGEYG
jgi:hypothetical protein